MSSISTHLAPETAPAEPWRAARYRRMLRAATEVLRAQAPEAVSMDDIAQAAGVGKATLYRYFESKEALLRACLEQVVDELGRAMEEAERAPADPPERLHAIVGTMVQAFSRHMKPLRPLSRRETDLEAEWRNSVLDARRRLVRVLRQHFDAGTAAGWYVPVDTELVPQMIMGMIRSSVTHVGQGTDGGEIAAGAATPAEPARRRTLDDLTDGICDFVLRAVRVAGAEVVTGSRRAWPDPKAAGTPAHGRERA